MKWFVGFSQALKGSNGEFELNRVVGFLGGLTYILAAPGFTAWHMARGGEFDIVAFCTAFAGGLGLVAGGTAGAVAIKDRNVASAKVIQETGNVPAPAASPPPPSPPAGTPDGEMV